MNAAQVRAKARMAQNRREAEIEEEELESGELNLVPYLDIVTNVMLFLLATVTSGLVLGTINSSLPEYAGQTGGTQPLPVPGEETPIQLVVAVTKPEILIFSLSGLEGNLKEPRLRSTAKTPGKLYDYRKVTQVANEIVEKHWPGKPVMSTVNGLPKCLDDQNHALPDNGCRPDKSTEVFLMVDKDIPYEAVIATMDALRQNCIEYAPKTDDKSPDTCKKVGAMLFPGVIFSSGIQ